MTLVKQNMYKSPIVEVAELVLSELLPNKRFTWSSSSSRFPSPSNASKTSFSSATVVASLNALAVRSFVLYVVVFSYASK